MPRRRLVLLASLGVAALLCLAQPGHALAAGPCGPPVVNPVACENSLPGDPTSDWGGALATDDPSILGFATSMSVNVGQTISFKIKTPSTKYHIDILRLGYYQGNGARIIAAGIKPSASLPQTQPSCLTNAATGLVDCGNWAVSASWTVPSTAVSGVYIAHLVRDDLKASSQIEFVVRDDSSHSDTLVQTSDATWQAYNAYGGNSLYWCSAFCPPGNPAGYQGAFKVSYNRPFQIPGNDPYGRQEAQIWWAEYSMIRFLEENGYDVSYTSESDVDRAGALLLNHKLFISSGHDEYWSAGQRANVVAARDAGVNLAFFSGNEMFWKTRWEPSIDGSNTAYRTLVSYKETHFTAPVDPNDPPTWTGTWRDPRFSPPADGGQPENAVTGQFSMVDSGTGDITVPAQYGKLRFWRNTPVASLAPGQTRTLAPGTGTLGHEWDVDADNGFRPAGTIDLSATTLTGVNQFTADYGTNEITGGTATHHLTLYRASSGALVFGAGTIQWSWGLDTENPAGNAPDPVIQQATVNLLADMGAQPATLQAGLVAASQSADSSPPSSTITSPTANATVADGSVVTVTGTAADAGGGVVAGVEVSTDGGTTWHPATLTSAAGANVTWSYSWTAHGNPKTTLKSRATDDSGNIETPSSGVPVNVSCPCSLWGTHVTPALVDSGDGHAVTLGVKFTSDTNASIVGIRFYKAQANTGSHIGALWAADGTLLAQATFTNESASGWQEVDFSSPVNITAGTTYIASYYAPAGHYSSTLGYFYPPPSPPGLGGGTVDSGAFHALRNIGSTTNGVFTYGAGSAFPTDSSNAANYWVDPVYGPITPPSPPGQPTGVSATAGFVSATVSWTAPSSGGTPTSYIVTPYIGGAAQAPTTVPGAATSTTISGLTAGTSYTFTVQASNSAGTGPVSAASNAVTPTGPTSPSAPQNVSASPATSQVSVSWSAPASNGGSTITGYTVTPYIGATAQTPVTVNSGTATSATVTGLTNGTAYTFTVAATNALGTGPASSATAATTPSNTIFDFTSPAAGNIDSGDGSAVELGVKFKADATAQVAGIRFYKAATNTGTHIGSLWTASGTRLAQVTFTGESASGWQTAYFATPATITAGTTYVASYYAPGGHYSGTQSTLGTTVNNPPLHTIANATSANGVYAYSGASTFPSNSYNASNYWVDVILAPAVAPGQPTAVSATPGSLSATVSWTAPGTGGTPTSYKITPYIGATAQTATTVAAPASTTTITGLTAGTSYTFTVQASNGAGSGPVSTASNAVTPTGPTAPSAPQSVTAGPATGQALVSWSAPASDGGSPITGYTVTPYIGATAQTPVTVSSGTATSATATGLTNGTAYTFTVKATNAIGTGAASAASAAVTPANTIFDFTAPAAGNVDSGDGSAVELGVKFKSDVGGQVAGIRFYKAATNTGTHIGSLWSAGGTRLAQVTFTGETASGWQTAYFTTPVNITAGTTYVASYYAPAGHYSGTQSGLTTAIDNAPLHTIANATSANGVYAYSGTSAFPSNSYNGSNYWVDAILAGPTAPGQVTGVSATAGNSSATVSWTAPSTGGAPASYIVTPYIGATAQTATTVAAPASTTTITGLTPGTSYTFTVQASNTAGNGPSSAASNAVTPTGATAPSAPQNVTASPATSQVMVSWSAPASDGGSPITGYTITPSIGTTAQTPVTVNSGSATSTTITGLTNGTGYTFTVKATNTIGTGAPSAPSGAATPANTILDFNVPAAGNIDSGDGSAVELGVKFTTDNPGTILGVRFYKAAANTGTHIGSLWTASGTRLAQVTFTGETASGWQTAYFSSPVNVTAGTTYIASYYAPAGHYSGTQTFFTTSIDNPPLHALANATSPNGLYSYGATSTFPANSYNASNYWVDAIYGPPTAPGQVTGVAATSGNSSATVSWNAPGTGGAPTSYKVTPYIGATAQTASTVSGTTTSTTITGLTPGTSYTFTVQASNSGGTGPVSANSNAVSPSGAVAPSAPQNVTASPATARALVSWSAPASDGGSPITGYTITPYIGTTAQTPVTVNSGSATSTTITGLTNGTAYTFTVIATNSTGSSAESSPSAPVTPAATIFDFAAPTSGNVDSGDATGVELGVKFTADVDGSVIGIRFYKAQANTGTHIGSLWRIDGTRLAQVTFTGETASGWQTAYFSSPVHITAGTTYVASYYAPNGHYSGTQGAFNSAVDNPPLHAVASPASANGIFSYGAASTFPTTSFNASNYWIDVLYTTP